MANKVWAQCPHCGKEAHNKGQVDKKFGWRWVNGNEIPQSWCKKCR